MTYVFGQGDEILHFLAECKEAEYLRYKDVPIEHFLELKPNEDLRVEVRVMKHGSVKVKCRVILSKITDYQNIEILGESFVVHTPHDFLRRFNYQPNGKLGTKDRRKNNLLIFKFIRERVNKIIQEINGIEPGGYKFNALNQTAKTERIESRRKNAA